MSDAPIVRGSGGPAPRHAGAPESEDWAARAAAAVAGLTSTRSKTPEAMFGGPGAGGATHCLRASGATVTTADERSLLDWTMALGAVSLGYGHEAVAEAVARAARDGGVGPLPPVAEVRVAERLAAAYPGAESARFFKTGAEAVAAAVRLARVATGREAIVHCGYHGWLDGATTGAGVPAAVAALWRPVPFDDVGALEAAVRAARPAAIVLEPVVERAPSVEWLRCARGLADEVGTVLVFDEIKTAFRLARGGAAERWGVRPDLAVLGKALANGHPLAAVVGRRAVMERVRETWVSSTLATEFGALAAAEAVLDVWERVDVAGHIARVGSIVLEGLTQQVSPSVRRSVGPSVCGLPCMWFLRFDDGELERRFLLACLRRGVLLKRGPYNFPSLAHGEGEARQTLAVVGEAVAEAAA